MCTMLAKINTDLTGALKSKNAIVVSVLRMVKAAIKQQEIDNKKIINTQIINLQTNSKYLSKSNL